MLSDGESHSHRELYALGTVAHSRIAELRKRGYVIEQWREEDPRSGETIYFYRLLSEPARSSPQDEGAGPPLPAPSLDVEGSGDQAAGALPSSEPEQLALGVSRHVDR